jgi:hypothetical protein
VGRARKKIEIDAALYMDEAISAADAVLPPDLPGRQVCFTMLRALMLAYLDRRAFLQSELDELYEAFAAAADAMAD